MEKMEMPQCAKCTVDRSEKPAALKTVKLPVSAQHNN
jgi:hypothetical protein